MRSLPVFLFVLAFAVAPAAHAQLLDTTSSGALQLLQDVQAIEEDVITVEPLAATPTVNWVDVARLIDTYRIHEKVADLRGVTVDPSGKNVGFYFSSGLKGSFSVYRNGRRMQHGVNESLYDMHEPVVFRMTASGDLVYDLHGTDLYVNSTSVSKGLYSFSQGATSVHEHGGVLTFPEGGNVVSYDIGRNKRTILYKHQGAVRYIRRAGDKIAYTVFERGFTRMYRNGRLVSGKGVENDHNFAISKEGDVYFFTKSARGYALYRNSRSYVTGRGAGAFVDIDQDGRVWHLSYLRAPGRTLVRLQRDRSPIDLLPAGVANVELLLGFNDRGYAMRASFEEDPAAFYLVQNGESFGESFMFEYPYNDGRGFQFESGEAIYRAYDGTRWTAYADGEPLRHASLKKVWFMRVKNGEVTVYATK